jgi:transcriptional regulator with XRE-family HTH domain
VATRTKKTRKLGDNLIGPTVRKLRYQQKLSQPEMVARCQLIGWATMSRDILASIELRRRHVTDKEVLLLAKALKVHYTELFPKS